MVWVPVFSRTADFPVEVIYVTLHIPLRSQSWFGFRLVVARSGGQRGVAAWAERDGWILADRDTCTAAGYDQCAAAAICEFGRMDGDQTDRRQINR